MSTNNTINTGGRGMTGNMSGGTTGGTYNTTVNSGNTYPKYFVLGDGRPGRRLAADSMYEVLRRGRWENCGDTHKFVHDAQQVSEAEFNEAVRLFTPGGRPSEKRR
jgi:hypothetical protein